MPSALRWKRQEFIIIIIIIINGQRVSNVYWFGADVFGDEAYWYWTTNTVIPDAEVKVKTFAEVLCLSEHWTSWSCERVNSPHWFTHWGASKASRIALCIKRVAAQPLQKHKPDWTVLFTTEMMGNKRQNKFSKNHKKVNDQGPKNVGV